MAARVAVRLVALQRAARAARPARPRGWRPWCGRRGLGCGRRRALRLGRCQLRLHSTVHRMMYGMCIAWCMAWCTGHRGVARPAAG